jgi:epoxyqueuosine reductase
VVDGSKCISYFTIELKDEIPADYQDKTNGWAFGCDVCQQVCPWNRFSKPHREPALIPNSEMMKMDKQGWLNLSEDDYDRIFNQSPVKRTKWNRLKQNLLIINEKDNKFSD